MKKDEILKASRKEHQNKDFVELEIAYRAGNIAGRVGATVCILVSLLARWLTGEYLLSPWLIYFSIVGTHWVVRAVKTRKKSDFIIGLLFLFICAVLFILLVLQLMGKRV